MNLRKKIRYETCGGNKCLKNINRYLPDETFKYVSDDQVALGDYNEESYMGPSKQ